MILLNGGKKKGLRISKRVESSHAAKNKTTPMTPSQSDIPARNRCHGRLVVSGFDGSMETRSKASCSCFDVSGSSGLIASECIRRGVQLSSSARRLALRAFQISNSRFQMIDVESEICNLRFGATRRLLPALH